MKTPNKGYHKRDALMKMITSLDDENAKFLYSFLDWLDIWGKGDCSSGILTKETHVAITQTGDAFLNTADCCINELVSNIVFVERFRLIH